MKSIIFNCCMLLSSSILPALRPPNQSPTTRPITIDTTLQSPMQARWLKRNAQNISREFLYELLLKKKTDKKRFELAITYALNRVPDEIAQWITTPYKHYSSMQDAAQKVQKPYEFNMLRRILESKGAQGITFQNTTKKGRLPRHEYCVTRPHNHTNDVGWTPLDSGFNVDLLALLKKIEQDQANNGIQFGTIDFSQYE